MDCGPLTGIPAATLQQYLSDARAALHRLEIGAAFVKVRISDGSETEFKPANINELRAYVDRLRDALNGHERIRGAIGIIF